MRKGLRCAAAAALTFMLIPAAAEAQDSKPSRACDFTDPSVCLYPWPNDHYTKPDASTPTGRRLALQRSSMPRNKDGTPIDPTDMNRADGFSPGSMLITKVPGLEHARGGAAEQAPGAERPLEEPREELAGRGHQRAHRQAPPRVRGDRLQPAERRRPRADHPAGAQLRRGRALHRGAPQPQERERRHAARGQELPPATATGRRRSSGSSRAAARISTSSSRSSARRTSSARASTSPGTSRWRVARA